MSEQLFAPIPAAAPFTRGYASGPTDVPLIKQTIGTFLDTIAARQPDLKALVSVHHAIHYSCREPRVAQGFPMTVTGKIQKFKIRDEMKNQLGLDEDPTA